MPEEHLMFSNADESIAFTREDGVKFVDVRFCDLPEVMQHFNIPVEAFTEDAFTDELMFDGSSIRGFQAIHESDMKLIPDVTSAFVDPFRKEKTLVVRSEERRVGQGECHERLTRR